MHFAAKLFRYWVLGAVLAVMAVPVAAQTTFTNANTILLPVPPGTGSLSNAVPGEPGSPYPSTLNVSGLGTQIQKLTVTIRDFRHTGPDDVDMLLVGPQGQKMIIWSDVGLLYSTCSADFATLDCNNGTALGWTGPTVTLDDAATGSLASFTSSAIVSGTYKPTNIGNATDMFPAPAPSGPYASPQPEGSATFSSVFNGTNPNGTWSLYLIDDASAFTGRIYGGWSLTITTAAPTLPASTTTITGDTPDPSDIGQNVTVSYSVTATGGTPTGNVTVGDGVTSCVGNVATGGCVLAFSTPGERTITANYQGSASFAPSSASTTHRVRYNTATTVTAHAPNPSGAGQSVTVNYTVSPTVAGGPAPTGNVTVSDGVNSCIGTAAAGACNVALGTIGARTLTATYAGDGYNKGSMSAGVAHQVAAPSTTTITSHAPSPSDVGQMVTIGYSVSSTGGTPTGNVTVSDGVDSCIGTVAASGCALTFSTPGDRLVTATYAGNGTFAGSTGAVTHRVRAGTTTVITADTPDPSGLGQAVDVSFTVTPSAAGGPEPTGNVSVTDGVASCTGTVATGSCNIILDTAGARTLTATYAGDSYNRPSTSAGAAHGVKFASVTTISSTTPNPSEIGGGVTVVYAVTGTGGTPTGSVTVGDGVNSCTATLPVTQCVVTFSTPGDREVTATYSGDANFAGSSATVAHRVKFNTTTAITADTPDPSGPAEVVTVNFAVTPTAAGGPAPTGNVTVSDGVSSCVGTATAGTCAVVLATTGNRTLTASYGGDNYNKASVSAGVPHRVKKASTTTITSSTPSPSNSGANVTVAFTVTGSGQSPGGNVTVSDGVNSCTATVSARQCVVAFVTPGDRTVTATYAGDNNFGPSSGVITHRVRTSTATAIVADTPDPSGPGQAVTVAYTVTPTAAGGPAPTGTVSVTDGVASCNGTVAAGTCTITLNTLGARTLTATYAGDNYNLASVSAGAAHQISQSLAATTTTIVSDTPDPSVVGQPYTVTYSAAVTPPGTGTPTGTVTVSDGTASCTGTLPATSCQLPSNTPGTQSLTATYNGSVGFGASTSAIASHQVNKAATATAILSDTPDPSAVGQSYTVSYSVAVTPPGTGTPTGTVTVSDGSASCTGTLPATSCALTSATPGAKTLTATYSGDANFNGSVSASASHQVTQLATTTAIVGDTLDPSVVGQSYTVSYSVAVTPPGTGTPTGTVTVSDGSASCTGTLPATSCQLPSNTPGTKSLTATYNGDANFGASTSIAATHQVNKATTTTAILSDTPDPSAVGQPYTVTYSVAVAAPGAGTPTGTVTISDGTASCTGTLPATSCQLPSNTPGTKSLTATYNGDINFNGSVSASAPHQVTQMATTTAIVSDTPDPSVVGQPYTVSYSVAVTLPGTGTPSGTVTVSDGSASCTGTLPATSCQFPSNTPDAKSLTATYNGDANFGASTSVAATHQVNKAATTTAIVSDTPDPSVVGQSYTVTYSVAVMAPGAGTPTGTVTISDGSASCTGTLPATSCALTSATPGAKSLTATYNGDINFNGSVSASASHQVIQMATTTAIVGDTPDPSVVGQPYTVSYSVAVTPPGTGTPTGTVTVSDGSASCTGTLPATSCQLPSNTPGAKSLTATFNGDANFSASASTTATHQVNKAATTMAIGSDTPDPSDVNQAYTVTYSVAVAAPGAGTPTGTVTVSDGSATCTGTLPATSCALTSTTPGAKSLTATYSGDTSFSGSVSASATHQVQAPTFTLITSHAPNPSEVGQSVVVAFSVTGSGGTPTGTVTVTDGVVSCAASVATGQCALTFTTPGERSLSATYPGDANFTPSLGVTTHRVLYSTTTTITSHSPNPSAPGQGFTVTYTVTPTVAGGPTPGGSVTVSDGINACVGTAAAGSCLLALNTAGTRTLTANYAGDNANKASASAGVAHTVGAPDLGITKTHAGTFARGQIGATYAITVTNGGSTPSAGTVSVDDNLPAGLTAVGISGAGWNCTQPVGPCSRSDALAPNANFPPLTLTVNVAVEAPASVTNTASVSGGNDANTSNNTATDPTVIGGASQSMLTVTKWGSATGLVMSMDGTISCGSMCERSYTPGATITLEAAANPGAVFSGWLGACTGMGSCVVTLDADTAVTANFAQDAIGTITLDIDDNGAYEALTDGILVLRYLFDMTDTNLTNSAIGTNANRSNPAAVLSYLDDIEPALDIDGNGQTDAMTDGLLVLRYMFGMRGSILVDGVLGSGATRSSAQIEAYLQSLMP